MTILDQIDRVTSGLCPCGAPPAAGSAYCSDDCRPTHIAEDTDQTGPGGMSRHGVATPMRWRPDLVTAADDSDLIPVDAPRTGYAGRFNPTVFHRRSNPDLLHLRLDDGYRSVGLDVAEVADEHGRISFEAVERVRDTWRRLERDLVNPRHAEPVDGDPWADVGWGLGDTGRLFALPAGHAPTYHFVRPQRQPEHLDLLAFRGDGVLFIGDYRFEVTADLAEREDPGSDLIGWGGTLTIRRWPDGNSVTMDVFTRSYLELPDLPRSEVALGEWQSELGEPVTIEITGLNPTPFRPDEPAALGTVAIAPLGTDPAEPHAWTDLGHIVDDGLREPNDGNGWGGSGWTTDRGQRTGSGWTVESGTSADFRLDNTYAGFIPAVNARQAEVLRDAGMRERRDFLVYNELPPVPETATVASRQGDPMGSALAARRNRNTGPTPDRLDGRRRRR